jgi:hypothetical protein
MSTIYLSRAEHEASIAQNFARMHDAIQRKLKPLLLDREAWDKIFSTAHPFLLTFLFCILLPIDLWLNFQLYYDITDIDYIAWLIPVVLYIFSWKLVSNYIRKINGEQYEWDIYNTTLANPDKSEIEIERKVKKDTKRDMVIGWIFFMVLIVFVAGSSYYRRVVLQNGTFGVIDTLPVLLFIATIFTGIPVGYTVKRLFLGLRISAFTAKAKKIFKDCQHHTQNAVHHFTKAKNSNEDVRFVSKDLQESLYRHYKGSSLNSSDYGSIGADAPNNEHPNDDNATNSNANYFTEDIQYEEVK